MLGLQGIYKVHTVITSVSLNENNSNMYGIIYILQHTQYLGFLSPGEKPWHGIYSSEIMRRKPISWRVVACAKWLDMI